MPWSVRHDDRKWSALQCLHPQHWHTTIYTTYCHTTYMPRHITIYYIEPYYSHTHTGCHHTDDEDPCTMSTPRCTPNSHVRAARARHTISPAKPQQPTTPPCTLQYNWHIKDWSEKDTGTSTSQCTEQQKITSIDWHSKPLPCPFIWLDEIIRPTKTDDHVIRCRASRYTTITFVRPCTEKWGKDTSKKSMSKRSPVPGEHALAMPAVIPSAATQYRRAQAEPAKPFFFFQKYVQNKRQRQKIAKDVHIWR